MIFDNIFSSVNNALGSANGCLAIYSRPYSCASMVLSRLAGRLKRSLLWICPDSASVSSRARELEHFYPGNVFRMPSYEHPVFLPLVPSQENAAARIAALHGLSEHEDTAVIIQASALMERMVPGKELSLHSELVMAGEETSREHLVSWLIDAGYERNMKVSRVGEFAVRGEIMDIFPPACAMPLRLLFFDDLVEEIRLFHPGTQRTVDTLKEAVLLPCREIVYSDKNVAQTVKRVIGLARALNLPASGINSIIQNIEARRDTEISLSLLPLVYKELEDIFSYCPSNALIILEDPLMCQKALEDFQLRLNESYRLQVEKDRLLAGLDSYYLSLEDASRKLAAMDRLLLHAGSILPASGNGRAMLNCRAAEPLELPCAIETSIVSDSVHGKGLDGFAPLADRLGRWLDMEQSVVIFCHSDNAVKRMSSLLNHYDMSCTELAAGSEAYDLYARLLDNNAGPGIFLVSGFLEKSFNISCANAVFLSDHEILSFRPARRRGRKASRRSPVSISEIRPGDLVVHRDHGIGMYKGLVAMSASGISGEFINIEYRAGDRLYLPVDRLGLLQRYVGVDGRETRLDKLGAGAWSSRKKKVKKAIQQIAHELVELYAARKVRQGVSLSMPDDMYRQFEYAFPFRETQDQLDAIEDILKDLAAPFPMDRLLCGDVGFGKTEVAMRAAFKAVQDGYQVAVLVPTTLLAEQHERTFTRRFRRFPVNIASISRFKTRIMQKEAVEAVRHGSVDILIGTHRMLQKDVVFKRLGLVIIDEEHRFGVRHKERLKLLSRDTNCLTLTATPIPRTLQLSLLGIRDLSTLETAPVGRLAIRTFLAEYDDAIVREAINREMERQGQVFFVHNRVKGIQLVADHLRRLVPEARIDVAHGQMDAAELEDIMVRFVRGDIDCLVCTTIIESGLDIPSANTLIVNRADRLGIADLYQLRGRVGRSSQQAYAYLLVPGLDQLGRDAASRLRAIMESSGLGAGMNLAMHDLKIRGAGNILGVAQAGQIADVGYDLYLDLLKEAVEELKGNRSEDRLEPEVNLPVPAFIPEEYVEDVHERLDLYRHFGTIVDEEDAASQVLELEDRFGPMPEEARNLIKIMLIKEACRKLNCIRLDGIFSAKPMLVLTFAPQGPPDPDLVLREVQNNRRFSLMSGERLGIAIASGNAGMDDNQAVLDITLETLEKFLELHGKKQ